METENTPSSGKKFLIWGILAFAILGSVLTFVGSGSGGIMSQFSGTNVTPSTALSMWQPSENNPKRAAVAEEYVSLLDNLVRKRLRRGSDMSKDEFLNDMKKYAAKIRTIAANPEIVNIQEIQDLLGYLLFEIDAITEDMTSSNAIADLLTDLDTVTTQQCPAAMPPQHREGCRLINGTDERGCATISQVCSNTDSTSESGMGTSTVTCNAQTSSTNIGFNTDYSNTVTFTGGTIASPAIYYFDAGSSHLTGPMPNANGRIDYSSGQNPMNVSRTYIVADGSLPANFPVSSVNGNNRPSNLRCLTDPVSFSIAASPAAGNVTYSWVFSNDRGNTHVRGDNPWSMTNYWPCGTCSSANVWAFCSNTWRTYPANDGDCPNTACGKRMQCQGSWSAAVVSGSVPSAPAITSSGSVSLDIKATYVLTWEKVSGLDYYVGNDDNVTGIKFTGTGWRSIPIEMTGYVPGSTHVAKVRACKANSTTSCSDWSSVSITVMGPSAPVITSLHYPLLSVGETYVLTWEKVSGMDYYMMIDAESETKFTGTGWWSIPLSGFVPGSAHLVNLRACKANSTTFCSEKKGVIISVKN